jgi:SAM-dependent methyltransferase
VAAAYDRGAPTYAQSWSAPHPWMAESREKFGGLVSAGMILLDVGCGPGHDSAYWTGKGLRTLGIDVSPKTIDVARRLYPNLEFQVADVLKLKKLDRKFDAVWMSYSLLHIARESTADVIRSIHAALQNHAIFFVETSVMDSTQVSIRPIAGLKDEDGREIEVPCTAWSVDDLLALLSGSFVVEWSKTYAPLPGRPKVWSAILRPI